MIYHDFPCQTAKPIRPKTSHEAPAPQVIPTASTSNIQFYQPPAYAAQESSATPPNSCRNPFNHYRRRSQYNNFQPSTAAGQYTVAAQANNRWNLLNNHRRDQIGIQSHQYHDLCVSDAEMQRLLTQNRVYPKNGKLFLRDSI